MASNLLDALNATLMNKQKVKPSGTQGLAQLLGTAQTGRAVQSPQPQVTSSAEIAVNQATQGALDNQQQANQIQAVQQSAEANRQQSTQQQTDLDLQQKQSQLQQQLTQKQQQLLSEIDRNRSSLNSDASKAAQEQLAATLAYQNASYLQALQNVNRYRRLDNEVNFRQELQASIFNDMESLFRDKLALDRLMSASDRDYRSELAQIDIDTALRIADSAARGSLLSAGIQGGTSILNSILTRDSEKSTDDGDRNANEFTGGSSPLSNYGTPSSVNRVVT